MLTYTLILTQSLLTIELQAPNTHVPELLMIRDTSHKPHITFKHTDQKQAFLTPTYRGMNTNKDLASSAYP